MNVHPLKRGLLYSTTLTSKCPNFSKCLASNKCTNFNLHNQMCKVCESNFHPRPNDIGGCLAEGEFLPDIQNDVATLQKARNLAIADPNAEGQKIQPFVIEREFEKAKEAAANLAKYGAKTYEELVDTVKVDLNNR